MGKEKGEQTQLKLMLTLKRTCSTCHQKIDEETEDCLEVGDPSEEVGVYHSTAKCLPSSFVQARLNLARVSTGRWSSNAENRS